MNKCPRNKIVNPKTDRCVLKTGSIGVEITKKLNEKILNPDTGRMVLKTGKIGMEIMKRKKGRGTPKSPPKVKDTPRGIPLKVLKEIKKITGTDCDWKKLWKNGKRVGKGSVGSVFSTIGKDGKEYVIKIQPIGRDFLNEVDILKRINGWVHAPKIYGIWKCNGQGYIVEEKLEKLTYNKGVAYGLVYDVLNKLHKKFRIVFPDCHDGNIMMRKDKTIVLIDFGWAVYFTSKNAKNSGPNFLTDKLRRPVTLDEMVLWENDNLADAFGSLTQQRYARSKLNALK
jgi:serine/threonine protein kinase